jgi:hypothetical protein
LPIANSDDQITVQPETQPSVAIAMLSVGAVVMPAARESPTSRVRPAAPSYRTRSESPRSVAGVRNAASSHVTVVRPTEIRIVCANGRPWPFLARMKNVTDTRNELAIATISHHALMRHQNQRSRYSSPVPAPMLMMISKRLLRGLE